MGLGITLNLEKSSLSWNPRLVRGTFASPLVSPDLRLEGLRSSLDLHNQTVTFRFMFVFLYGRIKLSGNTENTSTKEHGQTRKTSVPHLLLRDWNNIACRFSQRTALPRDVNHRRQVRYNISLRTVTQQIISLGNLI